MIYYIKENKIISNTVHDDITVENTPINCGEYYYFMGQERVFIKSVHRSKTFSNQVICLVMPDGDSCTYVIANALTKTPEEFDLNMWDEYLAPFKKQKDEFEKANPDIAEFREQMKACGDECRDKYNWPETWDARAERLAREKCE